MTPPSAPRPTSADREGEALLARAEAAAKPLGPFDESRARDFIGLLVHRGEIIDECLATIRRLEAEGAELREQVSVHMMAEVGKQLERELDAGVRTGKGLIGTIQASPSPQNATTATESDVQAAEVRT